MPSTPGTPFELSRPQAHETAVYPTLTDAGPSHAPAPLSTVMWPTDLPDSGTLGLTAAAILAGPSTLLRFCPRGFRRRVVVRGPDSLVSLLAFEAGQREHVHQHLDSGEHFHGVIGSGHLLIEDTWWPIGPGVTHFRPAGAWHAVAAASRLLLVSIQAPIPSRAQTVWLEPSERISLRAEDRESLARYRCCRCPCCGGHLRRQRPSATCPNCGSTRAPARCENCGWAVRALCLPSEQTRAS